MTKDKFNLKSYYAYVKGYYYLINADKLTYGVNLCKSRYIITLRV